MSGTALTPAPMVVLVPSPLLGPSSWAPVVEALAALGLEAIVAVDLPDASGSAWRATVDGVVAGLRVVPEQRHIALVGHSRAGPLLPAIGAAVLQPVDAYVFVDSRLPHGGLSPLEAMDQAESGAAAARRASLEAGEPYPLWTDDDLRELIPDPERREALLAELRPRALDFWSERLPLVPGWPEAPCGYLLFSDAYRASADEARRRGWACRELAAGHFHAVVDPSAVAGELAALMARLTTPGS